MRLCQLSVKAAVHVLRIMSMPSLYAHCMMTSGHELIKARQCADATRAVLRVVAAELGSDAATHIEGYAFAEGEFSEKRLADTVQSLAVA
jgi:hypothetical protein